MTLARFKSLNHPQQNEMLGQLDLTGAIDTERDITDDRATSWETFTPFHERFRFTVDAAASAVNAKVVRYWTKDDDGLHRSWAGERVWCNPPYSSINIWVRKAWAEVDAELVVLLLPANRTEQAWWQDLIEPYRDKTNCRLRTEFIRGRSRFILPGEDRIRPNMRPPFGCVLCIWGEC